MYFLILKTPSVVSVFVRQKFFLLLGKSLLMSTKTFSWVGSFNSGKTENGKVQNGKSSSKFKKGGPSFESR
jgi:hypothetical protein